MVGSMVTASKSRQSWYANYLNHFLRFCGFVLLTLLALVVYRYLLSDIITGKSHVLAYIAIWLFSSYLVLPRVNRRLAKLYLPNYFIGRARTGDGLLGDPINLAVIGDKKQLTLAMEKAGWSLAEKLDLKASLKMAYSAVFGAKYPNAPVSSLFLFNRKQDLAFEKDLDGNPRKRHHVRFWETPERWWLPGGYKVNWLGAATFDKHVGLSLFTGQVTHKIDSDVDIERDYLIDTLRRAQAVDKVDFVKHYSTSYHARNGGGDLIHTDGTMPFVSLN